MVLDGWLSVGLEERHDIRADVRSLPLPDNSADEAMAIHVLEHIQRWEADAALAEWFRVLKPGGRLTLELPELHRCCRAILDGAEDRNGVWGLYGDPGYKDELMTHKWGWAERELISALQAAGFRKVVVRPLQFHGRRKLRDIRLEVRK